MSLSQLAVLRSGNLLLGAGRGHGVLDVVRGDLQIGQEAASAARVRGVAAAVCVAAEVSKEAGDAVEKSAALYAGLACMFISPWSEILSKEDFFFYMDGSAKNNLRLSSGAAEPTAARREIAVMEKRMLKECKWRNGSFERV